MKHIIIISAAYIITIIAICLPVSSIPETSSIIDQQDGPIEIQAKTFEVDTQESTITFFKDIEAVRDDIKINCQKLMLFYHMTSTDDNSDNTQTRFDKIEATEQVRVNRSDGSNANAEKAVYYLDDNKVILTGNPFLKIKRGDSFAENECSKITIDLKEGRYSCEAAEDEKVNVIIFPSKKEKR